MKSFLPLLFTCLLFIFCVSTLKSQDTLFMKNGAQIPAKILEVTPTEVKYKKTDNPDGPTFITHGSDISSIKYKNGSVDNINVAPPEVAADKTPIKTAESRPADPHPAITPFGPVFKYNGRHVNAKEAQRIMIDVNDTQINDHIKKAKVSKGLGFIGFVAIPTFAFGVGYSLYTLVSTGGNANADYAPGIASGAVAVACLGTAITFNVRKKHNMKAAIKIYNEKY